MALSIATTTVQQVKLTPAIRKRLLTKFQEYQRLKVQYDALKDRMDTIKTETADIRDDAGVGSLSIDGYTTTLVAPTRKKFNAKKFVRNGGDLDVYNQSVEDVPVKAYEKITLPGAKKEEEEEDK